MTTEKDQQPVIAFLEDPSTHGGVRVERVDTHISRIFLAGDTAWKLKRAIRTNYLDFTDTAERERLCRRELDLNGRNAPFYLDVVPVCRDGAQLSLAGPGQPVDWLLKMRRFDRAQELDRLADTGALDRPLIEALADGIAAMHGRAPLTPGFGDGPDVHARIDQIAAALDAAGIAAQDWHAAAQDRLTPLAPLCDRRAGAGRVRRCHGDLHLGNIVRIDGRPVPFDAIEFNEDIASIDVLYDIAFTLMDLLTRGLGPLANALMTRYLARTGDYRGLTLLPLYLSMRAAVRAMVAASSGDATRAGWDMEFATDALPRRARPVLLATGGLSGTGKSTLARALAPQIAPLAGAVVIRSDVVRKRLHGAAPETPLPATAYTDRANRRVMAHMAADARQALRAGVPVILDATFLGDEARACASALARNAGVHFHGLWLDLPPGQARIRLEARGPDASDADAAVLARQALHADPPVGWQSLDAAGTPAQVLARARAALGLQPSTGSTARR